MKLSNIILSKSDSLSNLKIIDFGIAGLVQKGGKGDRHHACTLAYSPPELITGRDIESKPSLDIWALGVILYYLVTKRLPFGGDEESEFAIFESI